MHFKHFSRRVCWQREFGTVSANTCTLSRSAEQLSQLPAVGYVYLDTVPYRKALELQKQLCQRRINEIHAKPSIQRSERKYSDVLILLQHPPVYTNGRRNRGKLQADEIKRLEQLGCDYIETNRGGEITFHGPGQLVGYPIMYLKDHFLATKCFVQGLEVTVSETCARLGIKATSIEGFPGVWASNTQKVAALGTHVQRYVTSHGFALNCTTDMRWFREIVPCGLEGKTAVSLQALLQEQQSDRDASIGAVLPLVVQSFTQTFGCKVEPLSKVSPSTFEFIQDFINVS
ncbi:hypothetical protein IWW36_000396 [Coemansia brasiliensis]|uniref:lipoyl(octanoyl) transferase n=1 Tax=Coemansia brasiliensis TaxID=2650707 RepID=A0A9W8IIQ0_9FUNG|nr:hypothetical protein IWW36_000396 [Coemansia brasiliensis]